MKSENKSSAELKKRLTRSILTGGACFLLAGAAFVGIGSQTGEDEIPTLLRQVLEFNGELWSSLQGSVFSPDKPLPPRGKKPRVNGDLGLGAPVNLQKYRVSVKSGGVSLSLPLSAFLALPKAEYSTDFKCIEGWSEVTHYAGGKFSDFLRVYGLGKKPDGSLYRYVGFETPDREYFVSIDMDSMLHPQTVLAYEMNGEPLTADNGAPLRLIIPIKYGIKSIKRIGKIFFSDTRPPDYWADEGYDWFAGM